MMIVKNAKITPSMPENYHFFFFVTIIIIIVVYSKNICKNSREMKIFRHFHSSTSQSGTNDGLISM